MSKDRGILDIAQTNMLILKSSNCYWCNKKLDKKNIGKNIHLDHYVPLAKGGLNTIENIVISCSKCNMSKHSKDPIVFANSIGKLL
jgi:5-methylcytosine-specific restriction endonuclease McrA